MLRRLFFLFLFFVPFFIPKHAYADENFTTTYKVTYAIAASGNTHATFAISLKNNTDTYYASSYALKVGFPTISNVTASDPNGSITPSVKSSEEGQQIQITFNKQSLGKNAVLPFTISFDTPNIATQNGSIWEVNIPGLANQTDFSDFTVTVVVPPAFGPPVYLKPDTGNKSLTFNRSQLGKSGISIAFGSEQVYAYTLLYHLKNTHLFPIKTEIALPPNTTYQHISVTSLVPQPVSVREDTDGNWLATYLLTPSQELTVSARGNVFLSLSPEKQPLSSSDRALYTKSLPFWQAQDSHIKSLSTQLATPYAIYQYVVKTLHYDFSRVSDNQQRLGAAAVLQNPSSAVCLEFTDLFIALARAAGIPAREIDGFAFTQNTKERPLSLSKEILHAWPEYYDDAAQTWIMVDPTWENTTGGVDYFHTFDFDHVSFVIKGSDSSYPVPAGGYKIPGEKDQKDIDMTFASDITEPASEVSMLIDMPTSLFSGLPISGSLVLQNTGSTVFPEQNILVKGSLGNAVTNIHAAPLPPFGSETVPFSLAKQPFLTTAQDIITIQLAGKTISKSVRISPFSFRYMVIIGGGILVIFSIIIFVVTAKPWRLFIFRPKRESFVRGEGQKS